MKIFTPDSKRLIYDSADPMNDVMISCGIEYSHKKKEGWRWHEYEYMWKHHPTGKSGRTKIWIRSLKDLHTLCSKWKNEKWFYMPLSFSKV